MGWKQCPALLSSTYETFMRVLPALYSSSRLEQRGLPGHPRELHFEDGQATIWKEPGPLGHHLKQSHLTIHIPKIFTVLRHGDFQDYLLQQLVSITANKAIYMCDQIIYFSLYHLSSFQIMYLLIFQLSALQQEDLYSYTVLSLALGTMLGN